MTLSFISEIDYSRLNSLLDTDFKYRDEIGLQILEEELAKAEVVELDEIPRNLITMNTRFSYENLETGKVSEMTIVYPQHTDLSQRMISVTAPLGAAFLGLKEGDEAECTLPDDRVVRFRVKKILYQPEKSGDFHL